LSVVEQLAPAFGEHVLFAPHAKPIAQSVSFAQLALHFVVPLHAYPPGHVVAAPATQSPLPSHELVVCESPVHAVAHVVVALGKKHVSGPTAGEHEPAHALAPAHAARMPWGAPVTWEHMPREPATSQAWHWLVHALLQRKPSVIAVRESR
jgi:hypothetical protein